MGGGWGGLVVGGFVGARFGPLRTLTSVSRSRLGRFVRLRRRTPGGHQERGAQRSFIYFVSFCRSVGLVPRQLRLETFEMLVSCTFCRGRPPAGAPAHVVRSFID